MRHRMRPGVRLPLKTTQLLLFVIVIVAALGVNVVILYHTQRYISVFDQSLLGYHSIQRLHSALDTNRTSLFSYLRDKDEEHLRTFQDSRATVYETYREARVRNLTGISTGYEMNAIRHGLSSYFEFADRALSALDAGDPDEFRMYVRAENVADYVFGYIQRLMQLRLSEELETHQQLRQHARSLGIGAMVGIIAVGVLMLLFAALFARQITTPIRRLADAAHAIAHGELNAERAKIDTGMSSVDEIHTLCESFDFMQRNIHALVEDLKDKAQVERRLHDQQLENVRMAHSLEAARLQGLQAQINPHFLFNAMNTISRVALFERASDTTSLIHSLSNLLRYHLRTRGPIAALENELQIVREYVHIQEYRFPNRLNFELECTVDTQQVQIPCFTIQPLVENAVKYGIEPLEEGGMVTVRIQERNDRLHIRVTDSGAGMSSERRSTIMAYTGGAADTLGSSEGGLDSGTVEQSGGGIGLRNVIGRLHLLYQGKETFDIESREFEGTTITIEIPTAIDSTEYDNV
ncbi:MAG: sensor histidine kinase [Spirochaetota bacterium]